MTTAFAGGDHIMCIVNVLEDRRFAYLKDVSDTIATLPFVNRTGKYLLTVDLSACLTLRSIPPLSFRHCEVLQAVWLNNDRLVHISVDAFHGAISLTALNAPLGSGVCRIPDAVQAIDTGAFALCFGLKRLCLNLKLQSIGDLESQYMKCTGAFEQCRNLKAVNIPKNAELGKVGDRTFRYCRALETVTLPSKLAYLGASAFMGCERLQIVRMVGPVQTIPTMCFFACHNLTRLFLGPCVQVIGSSSFRNCANLQHVSFERTKLKTIGTKAFASCLKLETITFRVHGTVDIMFRAFYNCSALQDVWLPHCIDYVDTYAFERCEGLRMIVANRVSAFVQGSIPPSTNGVRHSGVNVIAPRDACVLLMVPVTCHHSILLRRYYWNWAPTTPLERHCASVLGVFVTAMGRFARKFKLNLPNEIVCLILQHVEIGTITSTL